MALAIAAEDAAASSSPWAAAVAAAEAMVWRDGGTGVADDDDCSLLWVDSCGGGR
jgi:hypothetical protein